MPLLAGDRLRTAEGRIEVALRATAARCMLDGRTTVDVQSDVLLRLMDGRIRLTLTGAGWP